MMQGAKDSHNCAMLNIWQIKIGNRLSNRRDGGSARPLGFPQAHSGPLREAVNEPMRDRGRLQAAKVALIYLWWCHPRPKKTPGFIYGDPSPHLLPGRIRDAAIGCHWQLLQKPRTCETLTFCCR